MAELTLDVLTPLDFTVSCTRRYWEVISIQKHPTLAGREEDVKQVLSDPEEIRRSRKDEAVYLFYRKGGLGWLCAVANRGEEGRGFLITAYLTRSIKAGELIWTKSK